MVFVKVVKIEKNIKISFPLGMFTQIRGTNISQNGPWVWISDLLGYDKAPQQEKIEIHDMGQIQAGSIWETTVYCPLSSDVVCTFLSANIVAQSFVPIIKCNV